MKNKWETDVGLLIDDVKVCHSNLVARTRAGRSAAQKWEVVKHHEQ